MIMNAIFSVIIPFEWILSEKNLKGWVGVAHVLTHDTLWISEASVGGDERELNTTPWM